MGTQHFNIGLVVANVEDDFSNKICKGAMKAAKQVGDNLFIFPAKYLDKREDELSDFRQKYEYQYNILIHYAEEKTLDMVLICMSSIGYNSAPETCRRILSGFGDIPVMLLASTEEGYSSICYENASGLREAIKYLIQTKGKTKIGMLTGPEHNKDANERLQVFLEEMQKAGLSYTENQVCRTNYSARCTEEVEEYFQKNTDLEAVVCANDAIAQAVYAVLKQQNREIGKEILVTGFDDIEDAAQMEPPLATVRADAELLGHRALVEAHQMVEESKISGKAVIPCQLNVRTSFILRESASGVRESQQYQIERPMRYKKRIQDMIDMNHGLNIASRDMLMFGGEEFESYCRILNSFTGGTISSYYLYLLKRPKKTYGESDWKKPDKIYLRAYRNNSEAQEPPMSEQRMPIAMMYSNRFLPEERKTFLVIDLYSREQQYGIMLCDLAYEHLHYLEGLCYQVSIAIKLMDLLSIQKKLLMEKEEMLYRLQQENIKLDDISNKDELTGVLNRRGFITSVEEALSEKENIGKRAMILYADLNFLKKINDHFSHEEGNFALSTCAKLLQEVVGGNGIAGRIGGDEFAGFCLLEENQTGQSLYDLVKKKLEQKNENSGKPYYVTMAIGVQEFVIQEESRWKPLLEQADDLMYDDKKKKGTFRERKI